VDASVTVAIVVGAAPESAAAAAPAHPVRIAAMAQEIWYLAFMKGPPTRR
jgi:hypothetical protein